MAFRQSALLVGAPDGRSARARRACGGGARARPPRWSIVRIGPDEDQVVAVGHRADGVLDHRRDHILLLPGRDDDREPLLRLLEQRRLRQRRVARADEDRAIDLAHPEPGVDGQVVDRRNRDEDRGGQRQDLDDFDVHGQLGDLGRAAIAPQAQFGDRRPSRRIAPARAPAARRRGWRTPRPAAPAGCRRSGPPPGRRRTGSGAGRARRSRTRRPEGGWRPPRCRPIGPDQLGRAHIDGLAALGLGPRHQGPACRAPAPPPARRRNR